MTPQEMALLEQLEAEWNKTGDVDVFAFLQKNLGITGALDEIPANRLEFVREAVQIDMERRGASSGLVCIWSRDEYLQRLPILRESQSAETLAAFEEQLRSRSRPTIATFPTSERKERGEQNSIQLSEGSQFGPYRVVREVGRGGMGTVYEAVHSHLQKRVALKLISRAIWDDRDATTRFRREMKAVGLVDHINVVRAMDAGEIEGTLYLVTEFVSGIDLGRLVREKGPRPVSEGLHIIRQAASALQAAHAAGIVHRDVKPSNLLLTNAGEVKLLDLGLARVAEESGADATNTGSIFGTPDYMAPEQWDDVRNVDGRADLYSLGCTLFYLLTGQAPFSGEQFRSPSSKMRAHLDAAVPALPPACEDPEGLVFALISKMMAKKPENRYATAAQVIQVIDNVLGSSAGSTVSVRPQVVTGDRRETYGNRNPEELRPAAGLKSESEPPSESLGKWLIPAITVLGLGCFGVVWWLKSGSGSAPIEVVDSTSPSITELTSSDQLPDPEGSPTTSKAVEPQIPPAATSSVPAENINEAKAPAAVIGNAHRRFAETALRLGRPVEVQFDGYGTRTLLTQLDDLPDQDFVVTGSWQCFASSAWNDENISALQGIHYWDIFNFHGTAVTAKGLSVLKDRNFVVDSLSMSREDLSAIGGILDAGSLTVVGQEGDNLQPWPSFLGEQPQLTSLSIPIADDSILELISHNKQLSSLELVLNSPGSTSALGISHLSNLPLLSALRIRGNKPVDELIAATGGLVQLRSLLIQSPCDPAVLLQLQMDRPDLVIVHSELKAKPAETAALKEILNRGGKALVYPSFQDAAEYLSLSEAPPSFGLYRVDGTGMKIEDLLTLLPPVQGPWDFLCLDSRDADIDTLTGMLKKQMRLNSIRLSGSAAILTGQTFENLAQLRNLALLHLPGGTTELLIPGEELASLQKCQALGSLSIEGIPLDDAGLDAISRCPFLMDLSIRLRNTATPEGLAQLWRLKWLRKLRLHAAHLSPEMFRAIGGISSLRQLQLHINSELLDGVALKSLQESLPNCVIFNHGEISFPEDAR